MCAPLRLETFIAPPLVRPDQDRTLAYERCLELVELDDKIGFDEAWFGEHYNDGWELINSPELLVIGGADRLKEHINSFQKQTGGFGAFLGFGHELTDREGTLHSHELVMRDVAPALSTRPIASWRSSSMCSGSAPTGRNRSARRKRRPSNRGEMRQALLSGSDRS